MNGERAAERIEGVLFVARFLLDHAKPGERPEMTRLARQNLADVGQRPAKFFLGVVCSGAAISSFGEVGLDIDNGVEKLDREIEILRLDGGLDPTQQQVGSVAG